jgi:hypothetical protein
MRLILAGIFHLAMVSAVLAQANGDVESIGFDHAYRPGCWTPMVVRLTPTSGAAFKGKIAIYQEDGDHDIPIFTRPISLRGNAEGGGDKTQRFWMYFIPQPDLLHDGNDPVAVNRKLRVYLTTDDSPPKQLTRLLVKDNIDEIDDANRPRSTKLVLCVTDRSRPIFSPYAQTRSVIGLKENVLPVMIPIANVRNLLPESVLGYDGVDAIIWCDADPGQLSPEQHAALEEFVHRGGKLVVCQTAAPNTWEMVKRGFGPLLPVDVTGIEQSNELPALKRIVEAREKLAPSEREKYLLWKDVGKGPYDIAVGKPKPGTIVAETEEADAIGRPWLVRGAFGAGSVSWVAQDLGESNLSGRSAAAGPLMGNEDFKWMYIWDRVLDWGNASQPMISESGAKFESDQQRRRYQTRYGESSGSVYHMTRSFLAGMEFPGTGAAYLGLAILFFIVYWIAAGPGSYLYLAGKKRSGKSWFVFALLALIATGITIAIVKMLLRGSAEIHHVSFVRMTPGEPTVVHTQFGLYIKRDGWQRVELKKTAADAVSFVSAYPVLTASDEGAPPIEYELPVFDSKAVSFYYRSTLKKLQAKWVGDMPQGIEGVGRISAKNFLYLEGKLVNKTGRKLKHIYFVFHPRYIQQADISRTESEDQVLYVPSWDVDGTIDLAAEYAKKGGAFSPVSGNTTRGQIEMPGELYSRTTCDEYWYKQFQHDANFDDKGNVPANFVLLSLYDHLPAPSYEKDVIDRWELHRAALRDLDLSGPLGAGRLIVLAQTESDGPLPIPIEVEGDAVAGEGTTYYQFILPLDRSVIKPTTRPATKPTTQAALLSSSSISPRLP